MSGMSSTGRRVACCSSNPSRMKSESRNVPGMTIAWKPVRHATTHAEVLRVMAGVQRSHRHHESADRLPRRPHHHPTAKSPRKVNEMPAEGRRGPDEVKYRGQVHLANVRAPGRMDSGLSATSSPLSRSRRRRAPGPRWRRSTARSGPKRSRRPPTTSTCCSLSTTSPVSTGSTCAPPTRSSRPSQPSGLRQRGHQGTRLAGRRDRDGRSNSSSRHSTLACRQFRPPRRAGQSRREVRERRPRRTTRRINKR
jgi:hypothetical protein